MATSLLTPTELADRWRRDVRWIREQAHAQRIPAVRIGGRWRFDPDDIADYERRRSGAYVDPLSMTPLSAARQRGKRKRASA